MARSSPVNEGESKGAQAVNKHTYGSTVVIATITPIKDEHFILLWHHTKPGLSRTAGPFRRGFQLFNLR